MSNWDSVLKNYYPTNNAQLITVSSMTPHQYELKNGDIVGVSELHAKQWEYLEQLKATREDVQRIREQPIKWKEHYKRMYECEWKNEEPRPFRDRLRGCPHPRESLDRLRDCCGKCGIELRDLRYQRDTEWCADCDGYLGGTEGITTHVVRFENDVRVDLCRPCDAKRIAKQAEQAEKAKLCCVWCESPSVSIGANSLSAPACYRDRCSALSMALQERLDGGANDCAEERESVKRWVDARQPAQVFCNACKRTPVAEPGEWCRDCHCVFGGDKHAPTRPRKPPEATAEGWQAWSNACDDGP